MEYVKHAQKKPSTMLSLAFVLVSTVFVKTPTVMINFWRSVSVQNKLLSTLDRFVLLAIFPNIGITIATLVSNALHINTITLKKRDVWVAQLISLSLTPSLARLALKEQLTRMKLVHVCLIRCSAHKPTPITKILENAFVDRRLHSLMEKNVCRATYRNIGTIMLDNANLARISNSTMLTLNNASIALMKLQAWLTESAIHAPQILTLLPINTNAWLMRRFAQAIEYMTQWLRTVSAQKMRHS